MFKYNFIEPGVRPQSMLLQDSRLTPDQRMPAVPRDPGFGGAFNPIMQQDPRMHQQMMMMMMQDSRMQLSPRTNYPEMQKLPNVEAFRLHQAMMEGPKMPFVPANFRPDATMQSLNHFAAVPNPKFVNPFASIQDPRTNHFAAMQGHSEQRGQTVPFSVMQDPRMQDLEPERDPRVQPFLPPNTGSGDSLVPSDPQDNRIYKEIEGKKKPQDRHDVHILLYRKILCSILKVNRYKRQKQRQNLEILIYCRRRLKRDPSTTNFCKEHHCLPVVVQRARQHCWLMEDITLLLGT